MGIPRRFGWKARVALGAGIALAAGGGSSGLEAGRFAPDPKARSQPPPKNGVFAIERPDCLLEVEMLDDEARRAFLQKRTGVTLDPFASAPGSPAGFLAFRVRIANRGRGDLAFQPQLARLEFGKHDVRRPVSWPDVLLAFGTLGLAPPPAYAASRPAILDGDVVLEPGGEVTGLLPFRRPPPGTKTFLAIFQATSASGETISLAAPYRWIRGEA